MDYGDYGDSDSEVHKRIEKETPREEDGVSVDNREEDTKADDSNAPQPQNRVRVPALRKSASQLRYPYHIADSPQGRMLAYCVIRNAHELDLVLSK